MKGWGVLRRQTAPPPFKQFEMELFPRGLQTMITSSFYYTPLVQLKTPSEEFAAGMRFLQRKRMITDEDITDMTEAVVAEYVSVNLKELSQRRKQFDG